MQANNKKGGTIQYYKPTLLVPRIHNTHNLLERALENQDDSGDPVYSGLWELNVKDLGNAVIDIDTRRADGPPPAALNG